MTTALKQHSIGCREGRESTGQRGYPAVNNREGGRRRFRNRRRQWSLVGGGQKRRTCWLLLLIGLFSFDSQAAIRLSGLDFWYFEDLENQALRGGEYRQLNTRPLALRFDDPSQTGVVVERIRLEYGHSDGMGQIQNRQGTWLTGGDNLVVDAEFGYLGDHLTLWFQPRVSRHQNQYTDRYQRGATHPNHRGTIFRQPRGDEAYSQAGFASAYWLLPLSNAYVFLGKDPLRFGAGKHDTLHLSDSAAGFPMIRLGTIAPIETRLGRFSLLTYVGETEAERYVPRAKFAGTRINWSARNRLEIGISRSWFAGGDGQNNSISNVFWDLYTEFYKPSEGAKFFTDHRNQQLVIDFRLTIPEIKLVFYGEFGREDHEFNWSHLADKWDRTQAHILGLKQIDIVKGLFWIIEKADTVQPYQYVDGFSSWYNHGEYRNGWTYEGIGLGHHLGADSDDIFVAVGYQSLYYAWMLFQNTERHSVRSQPPDRIETRREVGLKGFWKPSAVLRFEAMALNQRYENFATISGNEVETNVFTITTEYRF
jgi:hypothetical protein